LADCTETTAEQGDRNVNVSCRVRCKPPLTALFWVIDDQGTTLSDGQIVGEYWMLVQVQDWLKARPVTRHFAWGFDCR